MLWEMAFVIPSSAKSRSLGTVPNCSPPPAGAEPGLILEQRKEAMISAPKRFNFKTFLPAAVFKKCPPSATDEARGGSGLSLPTSECFFGTLVTVGSQRPRLQTDSTKNLVTTPLSSLPQSEPGSSLFVTCVCAYIIPVVNLS